MEAIRDGNSAIGDKVSGMVLFVCYNCIAFEEEGTAWKSM